MTLSFWLRDYLYIPLGGNRKGNARTYANLLITMLLGGLWHGASWNFVVWGGMHGLALAVHKLWTTRTAHWGGLKEHLLYRMFAWLLTLLVVGLLWIPFRCADFSTTMILLKNLLPDGEGIIWPHTMTLVVLACVIAWHVMYLLQARLLAGFPTTQPQNVMPAFVIGFFLMLIILFAPVNTSPFIYFQF